jgi:hypothetical protein
MNLNLSPLVRLINPSKDFQERRFSGAISTYNSKKFTPLDFKADVVECATVLSIIPIMQFHETLPKRPSPLLRQAECFGQIFNCYCRFHASEVFDHFSFLPLKYHNSNQENQNT